MLFVYTIIEITGVIMTVLTDSKVNSTPGTKVLALNEIERNPLHVPSKKVVTVARPILKALGLGLLLAATSALSAYSLIHPIIGVEMTRLIFLCIVALLLQRDSNSTSLYTNTIVTRVLEA